jgi:hypothetical protein
MNDIPKDKPKKKKDIMPDDNNQRNRSEEYEAARKDWNSLKARQYKLFKTRYSDNPTNVLVTGHDNYKTFKDHADVEAGIVIKKEAKGGMIDKYKKGGSVSKKKKKKPRGVGAAKRGW